ncbi:MAG: AI-2E family transporter [Patescibacteria group bacterium]
MTGKTQQTIQITTGSLARLLLMVVGLGFLYAIRDIVLIILVSVVIASSVEPLVRGLTRWKIPRVLGVLLIYLGGIFGILSIFYFLIPPLANDFRSFFAQLPTLVEKAFEQLQDKFPALPFDLIAPTFHDLALRVNSMVGGAVGGVFSATAGIVSSVFAFVFIFVISFYLAVQEDGIANVLRIVTPKEHETYVLSLWTRSQRKIGRWLQGQMLLGVIIGVLVFIALTILQVRYAFLLAVLSAVFEVIPYFGPIMAAIPAIVVASIQQPLLGLLVAGIYFIVQQMENHLIYPQVVRKTVGVPPLLAIIALMIGGKLAGVLGIIIAVPLAVILIEFLGDVEARKKEE